MACARAGSLENAQKLIALGCKRYTFLHVSHDVRGINHVSEYGESAIFFALRQENWDFLLGFKTTGSVTSSKSLISSLAISVEDTASRKLLINRAIAGDIPFFTRFLDCKIKLHPYVEREVLSTAIKNNHVWFATEWPDINHPYALYDVNTLSLIFLLGTQHASTDALKLCQH